MNFLFYCIALLAGSAIATQAAINSQLNKSLAQQPLMAAFISFLVGTLFLFILVLIKGQLSHSLTLLGQIPAWKFTGGFLGVILVVSTTVLAPKLGLANMLFFIILGQLLSAMLIDHFGLFSMPQQPVITSKIIGLIIILIGIFIFLFGNKFSK